MVHVFGWSTRWKETKSGAEKNVRGRRWVFPVDFPMTRHTTDVAYPNLKDFGHGPVRTMTLDCCCNYHRRRRTLYYNNV